MALASPSTLVVVSSAASVVVGYRNVSVANMKIELMESFGIVMVVYMLVMLFSDIDNI